MITTVAARETIEAKLAEADLYAGQGLVDEALALCESLLPQIAESEPILRDLVEERLVVLQTERGLADSGATPVAKVGQVSEADRFENCQGLMVAGFTVRPERSCGLCSPPDTSQPWFTPGLAPAVSSLTNPLKPLNILKPR